MTANPCAFTHTATFPTKQEASDTQQSLKRDRRLRSKVKLCGFCDCYHITATARDLHITKRGIEVLRLVAHGFTNKQVGEMIGTKLATVQWYVQELQYALGSNNTANMVVTAIVLGLINPNEFVPPLKEPCRDAS